ncbi:hypothetical protein J437_LFUL000268, partial [Ladona fulva]
MLPPGLNSPIISNLAAYAGNFHEKSKYCSLVFDEMAIRPGLQYNSKLDCIDGFVDDGCNRSAKVARQALVFSVQGILEQWKQPLAYYLSKVPTGKDKMKVRYAAEIFSSTLAATISTYVAH